MIVKIQRPIVPPPPEGEALIYDKHRTIEGTVPWSEVADVMGGDAKRYFEASYVASTGMINLGRRPRQTIIERGAHRKRGISGYPFAVCAPFNDGLPGTAVLGAFAFRPHAERAVAAEALLAVLEAVARNPMAAPFLARQHMDEAAGAVNLAGQHINTSETVWDALQAAIKLAKGAGL